LSSNFGPYLCTGVELCLLLQGDIVLEVAHVVADSDAVSTAPSLTPSKDQVLPKLIVKPADVVLVTALNVDLDYAVKGESSFSCHLTATTW